jgi:hypothetical protein
MFILIAQMVLALNVAPANAQTSDVGISETLKCSIEIASDEWSKQKPAIVLIRIENTSGRDLKFSAHYTFTLKNQSLESRRRAHQIVGDGFGHQSLSSKDKANLRSCRTAYKISRK